MIKIFLMSFNGRFKMYKIRHNILFNIENQLNQDASKLTVIWCANKKARMTGSIMENWLI